jgi:hypothetical protein
MGQHDYKTTLIYADYAPRAHERALLEMAFSPGASDPRHTPGATSPGSSR